MIVADIQLLINAPYPYVIAKKNAPQAKSSYRQGWESDGWSSFLPLFEFRLVLDPNLPHLEIESLLNEEKWEIRAKKIAALYARHVEVFQVWAESFVTFDLG